MNCKRDGKDKTALGGHSTLNIGHLTWKRVWSFPGKIEPRDSWALFLRSLKWCRIRPRGELGPEDGAQFIISKKELRLTVRKQSETKKPNWQSPDSLAAHHKERHQRHWQEGRRQGRHYWKQNHSEPSRTTASSAKPQKLGASDTSNMGAWRPEEGLRSLSSSSDPRSNTTSSFSFLGSSEKKALQT